MVTTPGWVNSEERTRVQLRKTDVIDAAVAILDQYGLADLTMRRLAGSLQVTGVPGEGTTIAVLLPLAEEVGDARLAG